MSDRASSGAPTEPGLLRVDVHESDDAARCPAHDRLVARAEVEVLVAVISKGMSLLRVNENIEQTTWLMI